MLSGAALGAMRSVLVALFLLQGDFGYYSSFIGASAFCAMAISFGKVEATTKLYPRLWSVGETQQIKRDAIATAQFIGGLVFALSVIAMAIVLYQRIEIPVLVILIFGIYVWLNITINILASMIRASDNLTILQVFGLVRGVVPLVLVGLALWKGGWFAAAIAETMASALTLFFGSLMYFYFTSSAAKPTFKPIEKRNDASGRIIYLANFFTSSTSTADRPIVTSALGAEQGGAYGILALIIQSGSLLIGVISQKVGPEIIRAAYVGSDFRGLLNQLRFPFITQGLVAITIFLTYRLGIEYVAPFREFFSNHAIGTNSVALASILTFLQLHMIFQFVLIAVDDERTLLLAGIACAATYFLCVGGVWLYKLPIEAYLIAGILARCIQILIVFSRIPKLAGFDSRIGK